MQDKFEQIRDEADFAVAIFGNLAESEFELFDISGTEAPIDALKMCGRGRYSEFVGVLGMVHGRPRTALAVEIAESESRALSRAFLARVDARFGAAIERECEWLAFAGALYALDDTRH